MKKPTKCTQRWKIGQSRSFPWTPAMGELFKPFTIANPPERLRVRMNKLTVTLTAKVGTMTYVSRVDRREFFA